MDKEFELLKRTKALNGEDFSVKPTRLSPGELEEVIKEVLQNYSFLWNSENKTIEEEVEIIKNNMYIILDTLVRMGVHPGLIMAALTQYNYEKLKNKDRIIYNNGRKKSNNFFFPYKDVRKELYLMENLNYHGYNTDYSHCYNDIVSTYIKLNIPYSKEPCKIDDVSKKGFFLSISNKINQINTADDMLDESLYLVDLLYTSVNILVEMGIKDDKLLINKIIEEGEKGKQR